MISCAVFNPIPLYLLLSIEVLREVKGKLFVVRGKKENGPQKSIPRGNRGGREY